MGFVRVYWVQLGLTGFFLSCTGLVMGFVRVYWI